MSEVNTTKAPKVHKAGSAKELHVSYPKIAELVKKERAEKKMSLRDLAEATELSHQQILRVERGICSIESALRVMCALKVPKARRTDVLVSEMRRLAMAS